jgi:hypothetical protein
MSVSVSQVVSFLQGPLLKISHEHQCFHFSCMPCTYHFPILHVIIDLNSVNCMHYMHQNHKKLWVLFKIVLQYSVNQMNFVFPSVKTLTFIRPNFICHRLPARDGINLSPLYLKAIIISFSKIFSVHNITKFLLKIVIYTSKNSHYTSLLTHHLLSTTFPQKPSMTI